jgi:PAS domain S-box-containing protein
MSLHDHERIHERLGAVADPVAFLTNLFSHAPVGFAVWTADGYPLLTNQAFMEIFRSEPPPGYNVLKDDVLAASGMLAVFQRAFAGETVHLPTFWFDPRELKHVTVTDGRRVAISMTIFPLFGRDGAVEYVAATYKDQTDVMVANEELRLSEERLRLAQQAAHIGAFEWNIQTGASTWTPELEAMYGLAPGELAQGELESGPGGAWNELIHPDDRAAMRARVDEALAGSAPVEGQWRALWRDGTVRWLVGRFQLFRDEQGRPHRLIGVNIDLTDLELLRREREATRAANHELEAFSYSVAHDLRAPLRAINGFGAALLEELEGTLDTTSETYLRRIIAAGDRMGHIIESLLMLARLSRAELRRERVDLSATARGVVEQLRAIEPARAVDFEAPEGLVTYGDPGLLRAVLENLLGNAWKFTKNQPQAHIELGVSELPEGGREYHVKDNGAGFDMSFVEKLFVPFQRLHSLDDFEGAGVGLATVHRIVERHGGRVRAEGSVGSGAVFRFTLP